MAGFFDTPIEYLKGVGPQRAAILNKELNIFTFGDLIQHYPFRYEDRTKFHSIQSLTDEMPHAQVKGVVKRKEIIGTAHKRRLSVIINDGAAEMDLVWFQGVQWANERIKIGLEYIIFGKPVRYGSKWSIAHPDIEPAMEKRDSGHFLHPVYPLTEKLRAKHLDSKAISKLMTELLALSKEKIRETMPGSLLVSQNLVSKAEALRSIHFPEGSEALLAAQRRLKFEELFYIQLRLLKLKLVREDKFRGHVYQDPSLVTTFYNSHLPFPLTDAQKKVIKEIYADLKSGKQMNRLLQGDVGSGKTIVAFICMLIVISG